MRRLSEDAAALEEKAELPRRSALPAALLVDHDCIQQPTAANSLHERRVYSADCCTELLAKNLGALGEVPFNEDVQSSHSHCAPQGVPVGED